MLQQPYQAEAATTLDSIKLAVGIRVSVGLAQRPIGISSRVTVVGASAVTPLTPSGSSPPARQHARPCMIRLQFILGLLQH